MIPYYDDRTFEQKFGTHCPFCGKQWSDGGRCGPSEQGDYTIRDSLRAIFVENTEKECLRCKVTYRGKADQHYCSECRALRTQDINREAVRRYRERHQIEKTCEECQATFSTHKNGQRFCTLSCSMKARRRKELAAA